MTKDEALKLALEALDVVKLQYTQNRHVNEAITAIKEALAQPVQEPVVGLQCANCHLTIESLNDKVMRLMQERNFCPRCGKRTADLTTIHTCAPPQIDPNKWAFDNGLEST